MQLTNITSTYNPLSRGSHMVSPNCKGLRQDTWIFDDQYVFAIPMKSITYYLNFKDIVTGDDRERDLPKPTQMVNDRDKI